jgi:hypothetical protein
VGWKAGLLLIRHPKNRHFSLNVISLTRVKNRSAPLKRPFVDRYLHGYQVLPHIFKVRRLTFIITCPLLKLADSNQISLHKSTLRVVSDAVGLQQRLRTRNEDVTSTIYGALLILLSLLAPYYILYCRTKFNIGNSTAGRKLLHLTKPWMRRKQTNADFKMSVDS